MRKMRKLSFKRREEHRTDYKARLNILKGGNKRLIVRKSNKYILAQIAESKEGQDKILCEATTMEFKDKIKELKSLKNIFIAYNLGKLIAKKATALGIKEAIVDIGINRSTKGSRIYAVLNGTIDGGLKIPHNEKNFPSKERLNGEHIKPEIKNKIKDLVK